MGRNRKNIGKSVAKWAVVAAIWIAAWQLLCVLVGHEVLLPSPLSTFRRLFELLGEGEFYRSIGATFLRVIIGFLLGTVTGVILAVFCTASSFLRSVFSPLLAVARSTPFASFIILALLWLKTGHVPVLTAAIMTMPIVYEGVWEGIGAMDTGMLDMAQLYNFRRYDTLRYLWIPALRPYLMAAAASSMGLAFKAAVAAEVIGSPKYAIGALLSDAKVYLETVDLFAVTAALILLSVIIERVLRRLVGP